MLTRAWISEDGRSNVTISLRTAFDKRFDHLPVINKIVLPKRGVTKNFNELTDEEKEFHTTFGLTEEDLELLHFAIVKYLSEDRR